VHKTFGGEKGKTVFLEYLGTTINNNLQDSQRDTPLPLNQFGNSGILGGLDKLLKKIQ
jgi:hypothetical protein